MSADVEAIVAAIEGYGSPQLAAWYVAQALSVEVGGFLKASLSLFEDGQILVEGDAVPVSLSGPPVLYGLVRAGGRVAASGLTAKPSIMRNPRGTGKVPGLALWDDGMRLDVVVDTVAGNRFDPKKSAGAGTDAALTIGLVFPNSSMIDLDVQELIQDHEAHTVFNVQFALRGADADGAESDSEVVEGRYLASGLERLASAGAQVVMFPELSSTPVRQQILGRAVQSMLDGTVDRNMLEVVIGGSLHHVDASGSRRNSLTTYFPGKRTISDRTHDKVGAFDFNFGTTRYREDVELGRSVRLFLGETTTAMVLICSDYLDDDVQNILRTVAPTVVYVASMTPRVEEFLGLAQGLSAAAQVSTVMVNNPKSWESMIDGCSPSSALWVGPVRATRESQYAAEIFPSAALLRVGEDFESVKIID
ncbi:hypothetical protein [Rhodococcus sp. P1Y]|uniref:hypothetical protein n=1 Tax=Rhodococcus sp. P1Y TaxID=1302308 RepID=UPI001292DC1F|nr:hypothetical protein [Rhodococcus sp. P1Y]